MPTARRGNVLLQFACTRECREHAARRSLALARLRRRREAFLNPRFRQQRFVGDGSGRRIAAEADAECHHLAARIKELALSQFFLRNLVPGVDFVLARSTIK
jgi:hypothetical protein